MGVTYDFSGWATKNNLRCSDGRTIRQDAFKECDGKVVPLVWNHQHDSPNNVLGHALLENRKQGVYTYCAFNDTEAGQNAKNLVEHGDVVALSIYANHLTQNGGDVMHGIIREVSLVLAGANPGAMIDSPIVHGEMSDEEAIIYTGEDLYLKHSEKGDTMKKKYVEEPEEELEDEELEELEEESEDEDEEYEDYDEEDLEHADEDDEDETVGDVFDTLTEKQKTVVYALIGQAIEDAKGESMAHADEDGEEEDEEDDNDSEETVQDVFNTLSEKQKTVVYALIGQALEQANGGAEETDEEMSEGGTMKHSVFENYEEESEANVLSHSDVADIFSDAPQYGTLTNAILAHGIDPIEVFYPEPKAISGNPAVVDNDTTWVSNVMNSVHHTPFARIKSTFVNLTEADARAKGYIKGHRKWDEVFTAGKRVTTPTTIYKKQTMDRDDIVDITDFDVVAFMKKELKTKLDEERARAYLVGDGRSLSSEDKINEQNIRPIWTDDDLYTIKTTMTVAASATPDQKAKNFIRTVIKNRKNWKGNGTPTMYIAEDMLSDILLLEDQNGRAIYDNISQLATKLRVKDVISVSAFDNLTREVNGVTHALMGIMVNLDDYNVGSDRNGAQAMFEDFDIDYNQNKYLIETRESAALVAPLSAMVVEMVYQLGFILDGEDPSETILGKSVADLQTNVIVNDGFITGTLKYVSDYTGYSGDTEEQKGNFLALKLSDTTGATSTCELINGPLGRPITFDSDRQVVVRVTNKATQKIRITSTLNGETVSKTYSLSSLKLVSAE